MDGGGAGEEANCPRAKGGQECRRRPHFSWSGLTFHRRSLARRAPGAKPTVALYGTFL